VKKGVSVSKTPPAAETAAPLLQTISAEELCAITGLTDRQHRNLAKAGYFPPPIRGQYQREATKDGLIRYQRELLEKKDDTLKQEQKKLTTAKRKIAEKELQIMDEEYVRKDQLGPALRNISLHQRTVLQSKLENEIAPNLGGLTPVEIRARLAAAVDDICRIFQEGAKPWMDAPP
jgi:hypothetical protein